MSKNKNVINGAPFYYHSPFTGSTEPGKNQNCPRVTVVGKFNSKNHLEMSVSRCSGNRDEYTGKYDNFSRKKGRELAYQRLKSKSLLFEIPVQIIKEKVGEGENAKEVEKPGLTFVTHAKVLANAVLQNPSMLANQRTRYRLLTVTRESSQPKKSFWKRLFGSND